MSIINRILQLIEYKGISKNQFYKETGLSVGFLDKVKDIGTSKMMKILNAYPDINAEWLMSGKYDMTTVVHPLSESYDQKTTMETSEVPSSYEKSKKLIPLYDSLAIAGFNDKVASLDPDSSPVAYVDPGDWFPGITASMRINGESMKPKYNPGCVVALKVVNNIDLILPGKDYVIETSEYRVLKRLQKSSTSDCLQCYSLNEEKYSTGKLIYEPFDVPKKEIKRLFRVLGEISFSTNTFFEIQ